MENNKLKAAASLRLGITGPVLFMVVYTVLGWCTADYSALRYAVSSLSLAPGGSIQITNFIISGTLFCILAAGLQRNMQPYFKALPLLVLLAGLGLIGSGIFSSDPVYGYPAGAGYSTRQFTRHGNLHTLFSMPVFAGIPVTCFVCCRAFKKSGHRGMAWYSLLTGLTMLWTFGAAALAFERLYGLQNLGGLFQRISITSGFVWLSVTGYWFLRKPL